MLNELWVLTVRAPDWTPEQSFPPKSSDVKLCSNIEARICNFAFKASHCLAASSTASDFSVQYASAVISDTSSHVMTAERTIKHEKYSPSKQYVNDIGLVKLKAPLNITLKGFRVKLPVLGSFYETGTPAMLSGWGSGSVRKKSALKGAECPLNVICNSEYIFAAPDGRCAHENAPAGRASSLLERRLCQAAREANSPDEYMRRRSRRI